MNPNKLATMTESILDEVKKLSNQSEFHQISDHAVRNMIREVLHFWEERELRKRFFEVVTDEEIAEFMEEYADCNFSDPHALDTSELTDLASVLNEKFEIRKEA